MIQKCSSLKVLSEFLKNPLKRFHIREISRNIDLAPTSVKNHINSLIKLELVIEKDDDVFKYYVGNFDHPLFRKYKRIFNLISIEESGLIEHIDEKCSADAIILFGSYAKGEDIAGSDIDLFVLAPERKLNLKKYEELLDRKIELFFSENILKISKNLRNNIINGIILHGYVEVWN